VDIISITDLIKIYKQETLEVKALNEINLTITDKEFTIP